MINIATISGEVLTIREHGDPQPCKQHPSVSIDASLSAWQPRIYTCSQCGELLSEYEAKEIISKAIIAQEEKQ